eukprot:6207799-Pleurochrysis_carterae.AAC.1
MVVRADGWQRNRGMHGLAWILRVGQEDKCSDVSDIAGSMPMRGRSFQRRNRTSPRLRRGHQATAESWGRVLEAS